MAASEGGSSYPLKDIPNPHAHDVLCGRGGGSNAWIGNSHWRMLVAANKQLYVTLPKRQKMLLSRSIVTAVRSQNPPGRFLQKDSKSDKWYDIGDQKAQEKTSQALREGAPELRTKLKDDKGGSKDSSGKAGSNGKRSDDEGSSRESSRSPVPRGSVKESNPPSRAASGSVSSQVSGPASGANSVGQVLPPASQPVAQETQANTQAQSSNDDENANTMGPPSSSMPPPAMRTGGNQPQQSQQSQQVQQSQQMQQMQQMPLMPGYQQAGMQQGINTGMLNGMQMQMPQGMPAGHVQQGPNGAMYYAAPNMAPMAMYPTYMYNQQGVLVQVMSVMPPSMPLHVPPQGPMTPTPQATKSSGTSDSGKGDSASSNTDDNRSQQQPQHQQQQRQQNHHDPDGNRSQRQQQQHSHFDQKLDGMVLPPPEGLDAGGLSFGSMLTESDMKRLEMAGASFGNIGLHSNPNHFNSNNNNNLSAHDQAQAQLQQHAQQQQNMQQAQQQNMQQAQQQQNIQQYLQQQQQFLQQQQQLIQHYQQQAELQQQQQNQTGNGQQHPYHNTHLNDDYVAKAAPPPDGGLEPQGLSFGSVSLMSIGDAKLENTGISFGSAMSFKNTPDMVDGGLEGIGMSFGSMTLDTNRADDQNNPHDIAPPPPNSGSDRRESSAMPTLFQQNRSNDNLLDCSDTDSETEEQSAQRSQHKSVEWEKMKALVSGGNGENANSSEPIPLAPPTTFPDTFSIPNTTFQRDFSQMSALSVGDGGDAEDPNLNSLMAAAAMPPPPPKKQDDEGDWQSAELLMLKSQQSASNTNSNYGGQQQR